jgi:hypothetical protein
MPQNIIHTIDLINAKLGAPITGTSYNKIQALDNTLAVITNDLAELNLIDAALGGLGNFTSIQLALTDIAALLTTVPAGQFIFPTTYIPVQQAGSVNIAASTINTAIVLRVSTRVIVAGSFSITGTGAGATKLRVNTPINTTFASALQAAGVVFAANTVESKVTDLISVAGGSNVDFDTALTAGGTPVNHFYIYMYQII